MLGEERRAIARKTLRSALVSKKKKVTPKIVAKSAEIEVVLFEKHKNNVGQYNKHVRTLWHNLQKNKSLRKRVLKSKLTGEELCELNPRDLATEDEKLKREKLRKMFMEQSALKGPVDHEDESSDDDEVSSERKSDKDAEKSDEKKTEVKENDNLDEIVKYTTKIWESLHSMRNGVTYDHEDMDTVAVELLAKLCSDESTEKDINRYYSLDKGWNIVILQHDIYLSRRRKDVVVIPKRTISTISLGKNADAIHFLDCDGTKISFQIEMRKMKEIMNGYVVDILKHTASRHSTVTHSHRPTRHSNTNTKLALCARTQVRDTSRCSKVDHVE